VSFAEGSFVNVGCFFDGNARVRLGAGVQIGMHTVFVTASHEISEQRDRRAGANTAAPIDVEDGVWIGARATILPGVVIGRSTVIGAGALVVKSCEADSVYFGSPARKIRSLAQIPTRKFQPDHPYTVPAS